MFLIFPVLGLLWYQGTLPAVPASFPFAHSPTASSSPASSMFSRQSRLIDMPHPLSFREIFEPSPAELKPSSNLMGLNGKRVRIVGFMAHMETPVHGGFYLCPRPTYCDESGGGTANLPPNAIRVIVRSATGKEIMFIPRAIEATGLLEIGPVTHDDGQVSLIRLILDRLPSKPNFPNLAPRKPLRTPHHKAPRAAPH